MPELTIPPDHRGALLTLARLDDDPFAELTDVLEKATPKLRTSAFARVIAARVTAASPSEIETSVLALVEMALVRATAEVSIEVFVEDVIEAMLDDETDRLSAEQAAVLRGRLSTLLAIPSVALPAKGRSLLIEHAHYMCEARLFTDVRPVFGTDVKQSPATALIVHTLKLTYHRGRADTRDFFVVLDNHDLNELSGLIDRARDKQKSLQALLASAGLEPLE